MSWKIELRFAVASLYTAMFVLLSVAFPAAARNELAIANSAAHCGAPALVPPT
jgi:hypothetical protein